MLTSFGLWSSSKGMVEVPNLSNLTVAQAITAITNAGLTPSNGGSTSTSNPSLDDFIASQLPNAGELVAYETSVSFIYYDYVPSPTPTPAPTPTPTVTPTPTPTTTSVTNYFGYCDLTNSPNGPFSTSSSCADAYAAQENANGYPPIGWVCGPTPSEGTPICSVTPTPTPTSALVYWATGCCSTANNQVTGTSNVSLANAQDNMDSFCQTGLITGIQTGSYSGTSNIPTIDCAVTPTPTPTPSPTTTPAPGTTWYCSTFYADGSTDRGTASYDVTGSACDDYATACSTSGYPAYPVVPACPPTPTPTPSPTTTPTPTPTQDCTPINQGVENRQCNGTSTPVTIFYNPCTGEYTWTCPSAPTPTPSPTTTPAPSTTWYCSTLYADASTDRGTATSNLTGSACDDYATACSTSGYPAYPAVPTCTTPTPTETPAPTFGAFGAFGAFGFTPSETPTPTPGPFGAFGFYNSISVLTEVLVAGAPGSTKPAGELKVGDKLLGLKIDSNTTDWTTWQSTDIDINIDNIVETEIVAIDITTEDEFIYVDGDLFSKSHYVLVKKDGVVKFIKALDIDSTYQIFSPTTGQFTDISLVETVLMTLEKVSINCEPHDNFFTTKMLVFDRPDPA